VSSPWITGKKSEALDALPVVVKLAKDTLNPNTLIEAENIARKVIGSKKKQNEARIKLMNLVAPPPKRPLYYLENEIQYLPRWTRDSIRYCGDYIDLLVKAAAFEFSQDSRAKQYSLGKNINILKSKKYNVPIELIDKLSRYNSFLYRPGKHDFKVPKGRGHRFTSREVVLTAFITMKLAEDIKSISKLAKQASSQ
jgi:hypothetical protein